MSHEESKYTRKKDRSLQSAELPKSVKFFLIDGVKNIFGLKRVWLYRDDGLYVLPSSSDLKAERFKKQNYAFSIFMGLQVTVEL